MNTFTLQRRFLDPIECEVVDSYDYVHSTSGDALTAMLLVPVSGPYAGRFAFVAATKDGVPSGAERQIPTDIPGAVTRILGEWCDERRRLGHVFSGAQISQRFERALAHPKFSALDVTEQTTEIKEAS